MPRFGKPHPVMSKGPMTALTIAVMIAPARTNPSRGNSQAAFAPAPPSGQAPIVLLMLVGRLIRSNDIDRRTSRPLLIAVRQLSDLVTLTDPSGQLGPLTQFLPGVPRRHCLSVL
jgi:hypothetical protein